MKDPSMLKLHESKQNRVPAGILVISCDLFRKFLQICDILWLIIKPPLWLHPLHQLAIGDSMSEIVLGHKYDIPGLVEYASPVAT